MAGERQRFCPLCDRAFMGGEAVLRCGVCGLLQHPGCWVRNRGCSAGCVGSAQPEPLAYEMAGSRPMPHPAEGTRVTPRSAADVPLPGALPPQDPIERVSRPDAQARDAEPQVLTPNPVAARQRPNAGDNQVPTIGQDFEPPRRADRGRLASRPPVEDLRLYRRHEFLRYWYVPVAALLAVGIAVGIIWGSDRLFGSGGDDDQPAAPGATSTVPAGATTTSITATTATAAATVSPGATTTGTPPAGSPTVAGGATGEGPTAVVAGLGGDCLNLRSGPGTSNPALDCLAEGTEVTIVGDPEDAGGLTWVRIQSAAGHDGWVSDEYLERR